MDEAVVPFLSGHDAFELLQTTRSRNWSGIVIDEVQSSPVEFEIPKMPSYLVGLHLAGPTNLVAEIEGRLYEGVKVPVSLSIVPTHTVSYWKPDKPNRYASLWLPAELVTGTAEELYQNTNDNAQLAPVFDARDVLVERLCGVLIQELHRPDHPAQRLVYEGASQALVAHLLREYPRVGRSVPKARTTLAPRAVRDVTQFIDDNLRFKITLSDLAAVAGSSRFHFIKLFRKTVGISPMEYLERSRVHRAQDLLRGGELNIAEIAATTGFADQSHFTRRFRNWTGVTPGYYRREATGASSKKRMIATRST